LTRTTLDIADDVLARAKAIAREQKTTREVDSELARTGLRKPVRFGSRGGVPILRVRNPDVHVTPERSTRCVTTPVELSAGRERADQLVDASHVSRDTVLDMSLRRRLTPPRR